MNTDLSILLQTWMFATTTSGVSPEAERLCDQVACLVDHLNEAVTIGQKKREMREELIHLYRSCDQENWDGYGAQAVDFSTYCVADRFLTALPNQIPCPDISAEPDGAIAFEWRVGQRKVVTVSINSRSEITYAAIIGSAKAHGIEHFLDEVPQTVLAFILRTKE